MTAYPSGAPEFIPGFMLGSRYTIFSFKCMLCRSLLYPFVLFSFGHCVVCSSSIYGFWLALWYLQAIPRPTTSEYLFGICKVFIYLRPLIISLVSSRSSYTYDLWLSLLYIQALLRPTASDYLFGIFKLFFDLQLLIISLVSSNLS